MLTLYIGNKNYSSWSLRPWLVLRWAGLEFDERIIQLGGPGYGKSRIPEIRAVSPSGRVPALVLPSGDTVHDSLAIAEWVHEQRPEAQLWPTDPWTRALARAVTAEMHSSFGALRRDLAMNIRRRVRHTPSWPDDTRADIERIEEIWSSCLRRSGGPFLFGQRCIADAFYAPVVTRFRTYGAAVSDVSRRYVDTVLTDSAMVEWEQQAGAEPWTVASTDALHPGC